MLSPARSRRSCRNSRRGARSTPGPHRPPCWRAPRVEGQKGTASSAPSSYYPVAVSAIPPSGQQYVLTSGDLRAVVTEVGAGLRTYAVGGRDVIDGYGEDEICPIGRGQVLLPWPNRIEDGQYEFDGTLYQTPLTAPARHNALHGLTRWLKGTALPQPGDHELMPLVLDPPYGHP